MSPKIALSRSEPLFFSLADHRLYGFYCPVDDIRNNSPGLVVCHSVGIEQAVPSNMLARIVRKASTLGIPAMLFHARGHGDSTGDFSDVTFETLVEDSNAAADFLRSKCGCSKIVWLGVRFGGLVAASCAVARDDTAGLVLWEPVHRGIDYFRQLLRGLLFAATARGARGAASVDELLARVERDGWVDVNATYIYSKLLRSARSLQIAQILDGWRASIFLAQVQPRMSLSPDNASLIDRLTQTGGNLSTVQIKDEPGWQFWRPSWYSQPLLEATGGWLDGLA
jgi:pimeloyl-ACP methyl ester carboxylesterase